MKSPLMTLVTTLAVCFLGVLNMTATGAENSFGQVKSFDPAFDKLVSPGTGMQQLASGFTWAEGPVWIADGGYLLFSDIPRNSVMKYKEGEGISVFLNPSGYTGHDYYGLEPGSNGLTLDAQGQLRQRPLPGHAGGSRLLT